MTPDERQLISGLFDRMRTVGAIEKDRDAEALIVQAVRQMPDAPYMLVQSVLVQEVALQQADQRIRDLEERMGQLEQQDRPAASGGGFLGGLFGGGGRPGAQPGSANRGSVPAMPRQSPGFGGAQTPWAQQGQQQPAQQAMGGGGSFMRSAMATAAGVAGGMLLADGIRNMMNSPGDSGGAKAAESQPASNTEPPAEDAQHDDNVQDAGYDDSSDWGGGDMEI